MTFILTREEREWDVLSRSTSPALWDEVAVTRSPAFRYGVYSYSADNNVAVNCREWSLPGLSREWKPWDPCTGWGGLGRSVNWCWDAGHIPIQWQLPAPEHTAPSCGCGRSSWQGDYRCRLPRFLAVSVRQDFGGWNPPPLKQRGGHSRFRLRLTAASSPNFVLMDAPWMRRRSWICYVLFLQTIPNKVMPFSRRIGTAKCHKSISQNWYWCWHTWMARAVSRQKKLAMKIFPNFAIVLFTNIASFRVWNSKFGSRFPLAVTSST